MRRTSRRIISVTATAAFLGFTLAAPAAASGTHVFIGTNLDVAATTITLPLYAGSHDGQRVWYVLTESSNDKDAERRKLNPAPKLANALGTRAVQRGQGTVEALRFDGTVDFSPQRVVVPGPNGFPPQTAQAGAVGDADYSPLVTRDGVTVYNATHVANASGLHDAVVSIDRRKRTVTMDLLNGFYEGNRIMYLHQEASVELVAAIEGSTFAPNLDAAPGEGSNDPDTSARSAIIPVVNGERGISNPDRQGLESALLGEGDPLNITQEVPEDNLYSPMWDISPAVWTQEAIDAGQRHLLTDAEDVAELFAEGQIVSGGNGKENESLEGLRALPAISNCPVVVEFG
jgi:hypothetical protein